LRRYSKVITSSWLDGEKLSQSNADDVGELVNVGVICYLKQLLAGAYTRSHFSSTEALPSTV
jgi:hypothetical protein